MDNYYNSVKLSKILLENTIYVCGTLRKNEGTLENFNWIIKLVEKGTRFIYRKTMSKLWYGMTKTSNDKYTMF